jgi:hypothetical protein
MKASWMGAIVMTMAVVTAACGEGKSPAVNDPVTADEAGIRAITQSLESSLSRSSDGLTTVPVRGGGERVDLQGRFQSAAVAKVGPDGRVVTDCVDTVEDADAFLRAPAPAPTRSDR